MNRRWHDNHPYRIARPEQVGYSFDTLAADFDSVMRADDEMIPGRDDLGEVDPGFADIATPIDPRDFVKPDGSYDVTELNAPDPDAVAAINEHKRRLREASPVPMWKSEEVEL